MRLFDRLFFPHFYRRVKQVLPSQNPRALEKLTFLAFAISMLEFTGLLLILPVINVILDENAIQNNFYLQQLYDFLPVSSRVAFILAIMGGVVLYYLLKNLLLFWATFKQARMSFTISEQISSLRLASYLRKPYDFHVNRNSGYLVRNLTAIPFSFSRSILSPLTLIINELLVASLIIIGLLIYDFVLCAAILCFFIPSFLLYFRLANRKLKQLSRDNNKATAAMNVQAFQIINHFQEITLSSVQSFFQQRFHAHVWKLSQLSSNLYVLNNFGPRAIEVLAVLAIFVILATGFSAGKSTAELGLFLATFAVAISRLFPSANRLFTQINILRANEYVLDQLADIGEAPTDTAPHIPSAHAVPLSFREKIELRNLGFRYSDHTKPLLQNLNLTIKKREAVGVIGPSGSGKTTLIRILLRLYAAQEGGIFVDGERITRKNVGAWYDMVALVPQHINLLDGTFAENVAFGIPPQAINRGKVKEALEKAQLASLLEESPDGMDTRVGEQGLKISGGQRQRLAIARAIYSGAQILIFDEATSSLDRQTEAHITDAIKRLSQEDLTFIIIAHRMESLKHCDAIYHLENGSLTDAMAYEEAVKRF